MILSLNTYSTWQLEVNLATSDQKRTRPFSCSSMAISLLKGITAENCSRLTYNNLLTGKWILIMHIDYILYKSLDKPLTGELVVMADVQQALKSYKK